MKKLTEYEYTEEFCKLIAPLLKDMDCRSETFHKEELKFSGKVDFHADIGFDGYRVKCWTTHATFWAIDRDSFYSPDQLAIEQKIHDYLNPEKPREKCRFNLIDP